MPAKQQEEVPVTEDAQEAETKVITDAQKAEAQAAYEAWVKQNSSGAVLVQIATRGILRESGLVVYTTDPVGETVDNALIKAKVWAEASGAIVKTQDDLDTLPVNRYALASTLLDRSPVYHSEEWYDQDVIWRKGWEKAEKDIWKLIEHKYGTALQRMTRENLPGHVFVKADDSVYIVAPEGARFVADKVYKPEDDKLELLAVTVGTQRALFEGQMPALKGQGTSLKTLANRVARKANGAYDAKASLNNGDTGGDEQE
jgi:hypothetical protein